MELVMKNLYFCCLLLISSNSFCNDDIAIEALDQSVSQRFDLGYCNPVLDYCSASFDFKLTDKADTLVSIDKTDTPEFILSNPKGPNCLSADLDSNSTVETVDYDCGIVLEVINILAN
jgi:hypothetical protein